MTFSEALPVTSFQHGKILLLVLLKTIQNSVQLMRVYTIQMSLYNSTIYFLMYKMFYISTNTIECTFQKG